MRSHYGFAVLAAIAAALLWTGRPASASAALQSCTHCDIETIVTNPNSPPGCFANYTLTITGEDDGTCTSTPSCTDLETCVYNISIVLRSKAGEVCDFAIGLPFNNNCAVTYSGTPACGSCTQLAYANPIEPATVPCDELIDNSKCYEAKAGPGGSGTGPTILKVEFKCHKCS